MVHLWVRAEQRPDEERVGLIPEGARALIAAGFRVTVEDSPRRCVPTARYAAAGAEIVPEGSWTGAPQEAIVFGLKELPDDGTPLRHRHIMFGHAYKGQADGQRLLRRFRSGGGTLLDLEYLTDKDGRRVAAFGYWAGYAGAAVALQCWIAQQRGGICGPVGTYGSAEALLVDLQEGLGGLTRRPGALIIGALGRVGTGAGELCKAMDVPVTGWDLAETAHGGPFPEVLEHEIFLNCILARAGAPVFVGADAGTAPRRLRVIGDIACDPASDFSPVKLYDRTTTRADPALRVHDDPPLDVTAIDNLPSMLPVESSQDFAAQLLPTLLQLDDPDADVWQRVDALFDEHGRRAEP